MNMNSLRRWLATVNGYYRGYHARVSRLRRRLFYVFSVGVVVHELAHVLMCRLTGITIDEVVYFKADQLDGIDGNAGGYVNYTTNQYKSAILVSIAPTFLSLPLGFALVAFLTTQYPPVTTSGPHATYYTIAEIALTFGIGWTAISMIYNSVASQQDLEGIPSLIVLEFKRFLKAPLHFFRDLLYLPVILLLLLPLITLSFFINTTENFLSREVFTIAITGTALHLGRNWEYYVTALREFIITASYSLP